MPEAFLAILIHTPGEASCIESSQVCHAVRSGNSRIGRSSRGMPAPTLVGSCRYSRPPVMAAQSPLYALVVLLSTTAPEEQRTKILSDVETKITSAEGSIERRDDWGQRPLAYRIDHQP